ncbi:MAG: YdcH family protein [Methylocystis sp.]|uniref:YdcH family protein n=1 Tax=Methylocystis sp. TaxID=1911079 RepID=UPI003D1398A9
MNEISSEIDKSAIRAEVERLRLEHHDLETAIDALLAVGGADQLQIQRLKKRKLLLRDRIAYMEDQLTPDIIA